MRRRTNRQRRRHDCSMRLPTESDRTAEIRRIYADQARGINAVIRSTTTGKIQKEVAVQDLFPCTTTSSYRIVSKRNYSARKVKRLKSTTFNSGSASFNTSLTVFLPSMMSSWFSKQTSFKNLPRRPLAIF